MNKWTQHFSELNEEDTELTARDLDLEKPKEEDDPHQHFKNRITLVHFVMKHVDQRGAIFNKFVPILTPLALLPGPS